MFPHVAVTGKLSPGISWVAMRGKYVSWIVTFLVVNIVMGILLSGVDLLAGALDAENLNRWLFAENKSDFTAVLGIASKALHGTLLLGWAGIAEAANIAALSFIYQGAVRPEESPHEEPTAG